MGSQASATLHVMPWNPWRELCERPELTLAMADLPTSTGGAVAVPFPDGDLVLLDRGLTQAERKCALAHELVHHERSDMPPSWEPVAVREERIVDDTAVLRLMPPHELMRVCVELEMACTHVEPHHFAEHFHVSETMARRALELLDKRLTEPVERVHG